MQVIGFKLVIQTTSGTIELPCESKTQASHLDEHLRYAIIKHTEPEFQVPGEWADIIQEGHYIEFNTITIMTAHIVSYKLIGIVEV